MFIVRVLIGGAVVEINPTIYLLSSIFFISCILSTSKKISILNTEGISSGNIFYKLLKEQNQNNKFTTLYIVFSIFSTGSLLFWFLDLNKNNISVLRQGMLLLSILDL